MLNSSAAKPLLQVDDLQVSFRSAGDWIPAVDRISFSVEAGESLAIVGESGSGKSVTALSIMRLVELGGGRITGGAAWFENHNLVTMQAAELRALRGRGIGMIFQEPMTSLNPVFPVGEQIAEVFRIHKGLSQSAAWKAAVEMLELVKIPAAARRAGEFPHQLSGGMRQRVMIAMALACRPRLLIADEPTTALDVTIQAQIMKLILELQADLGMALLLITHDLGVVAETCDRVVVMYGGEIVESAEVEQLFGRPGHPYTQGLLDALPKLGEKKERLKTIEGNVPTLGAFPVGCKFRTRCPHAFERCAVRPDMFQVDGSSGQLAACWLREK